MRRTLRCFVRAITVKFCVRAVSMEYFGPSEIFIHSHLGCCARRTNRWQVHKKGYTLKERKKNKNHMQYKTWLLLIDGIDRGVSKWFWCGYRIEILAHTHWNWSIDTQYTYSFDIASLHHRAARGARTHKMALGLWEIPFFFFLFFLRSTKNHKKSKTLNVAMVRENGENDSLTKIALQTPIFSLLFPRFSLSFSSFCKFYLFFLLFFESSSRICVSGTRLNAARVVMVEHVRQLATIWAQNTDGR